MQTDSGRQVVESARVHYLVDGTRHLSTIEDPDEALIWSALPGVQYLVGPRYRTANLESLAPERVYLEAWCRLRDAEAELRSSLQQAEVSEPEWRGLSEVMCRSTLNLAATLAAKSIAFSAFITATHGHRRIVVGDGDLSQVRNASPILSDTDNVFAALASRLTSDVERIEFPRPDASTISVVRDAVPWFDQFFNIVNRTSSALASKLLLSRMPLTGLFARRGTLLYLLESDYVEEAFLRLVWRGWQVIPQKTSGAGEAPGTHPGCISSISGQIRKIWRDCIEGFVSKETADAAEMVLIDRVEAAVAQVPAVRVAARKLAESSLRDVDRRKPVIAISSGLYSPLHRMLSGFLRDMGVPVVCFEHGPGLGVAAQTDAIAHDLQGFCDRYLVHNRDTRLRFERDPLRKGSFVEIGSPALIQRARFPRIQAALARRYLGVSRRTPMLMYVCNLLMNNRTSGWGQTVDYYYAAFRSKVANELGSFAGMAVIKTYPSQRFSDPDPIIKAELPTNVRVAPYGELRHTRWAADVILLDICSSTLGWVLAHDVPLIYVDNSSYPLSERARDALAASVLFVDSIRDPNWQLELRSFLSMSDHDRREVWHQRRHARAQFIEEFGLGPTGDVTGRFLDELDDLAGRCQNLRAK